MSKLFSLGLVAVALVFSAKPAQEKFAKYKAIEAYEVRPGVLMIPTYSADGRVCEIGLEKLHYTPEIIRLDSSLTRDEIEQIFDELVPAGERGPKSKDLAGGLITQAGHSLTTLIDFEKVQIQIHGKTSPNPGKKGIMVDEVAATLKWKDRTCR